MEILGYLHAAVEFEDSTDSVPFGDENGDIVNARAPWECLTHSTSLPLWVRSSSLGLSALLCSLSLLIGVTPRATAMMQNGDEGLDVTLLQQELADLGYFNTNVTGYFGDITEAAVEQFQRANGLVVDGVVGPATEAVLQALTTPTTVVTPTIATTSTVATPTVAIANTTPTVVSTVPTNVVTSPNIVTSPVVQRQLVPGLSGADVTQLQTQLTQVGVYQGPITGFYGPLTQAAVTRFQQLNGLVASGIADSTTLTVLNQALIGLETVVVESVEVVPMVTTPVVTRPATQQVVVQTVPQPVVTRPSTDRVVVVPPSNEVIYRGDSGQPVRQIQEILTDIEIYDGPITGYYGSLTEEAVARFQQRVGLDVNGITGPITWQALLNASEII
ncbi:MAG: peptidoglycan-binding domain-containing protein [Cyanobacteria bacterium J06627_8]